MAGRVSNAGYTVSLHRSNESPEDGYGYCHLDFPITQYTKEQLQTVLNYFNAEFAPRVYSLTEFSQQ